MKNFLRFLRLYCPYKWHVVCGIFLSLITVFSGICLLAVSGWFIAAMGIAGAASITMNYFTPAAMIRGLAILRTAGRYGERLANHDAALRVTAIFREWFYNRLEPLAPAGLSDLHSADIFNRLRGDIDVLERFYLNGIVPLCTAFLALVIMGVVLTLYYLPLAVLQLSLLILAGVVVPVMMRKQARKNEAVIAEEKAYVTIDLAEMMHGMGEYLVYGRMGDQITQIEDHDTKISSARKAVNLQECMIQSFILLSAGLSVAGAVFLMIPLVRSDAVGTEQLAMGALLCLACFDIVTPLPAALQSLQAARMASHRIFEIVDRPLPILPGPDTLRSKGDTFGCALHLENICFSYKEKQVLSNVSFSLRGGEMLVLTGPSGAGKSTLLDILLGFYLPTSGNIFLQGMHAGSYDGKALRAFFSLAPQQPYFFADTLHQNITLGKPDASKPEIEDVCGVSYLQDVIDTLPAGLETYVGQHGALLSGGQLRRAAIARALLRPAPILLLDEPTEGLDAELEDLVMRSVLDYAAKRGQAVILCLHEDDKKWLPQEAKIVRL